MRSGKLAFDIGANVGNMTEAMLESYSRVIAVEPNPVLAEGLRKRFKNRPVEVVEAAVGRKGVRLATLTVPPNGDALGTLLEGRPNTRFEGWFGWGADRKYTVQVTTLEDLFLDHGEPDYIKIDVEGTEIDVLSTMWIPIKIIRYEWMAEKWVDAVSVAGLLGNVGRDNRLSGGRRYIFEIEIGEGAHVSAPMSFLELMEKLGVMATQDTESWGNIVAYLVDSSLD